MVVNYMYVHTLLLSSAGAAAPMATIAASRNTANIFISFKASQCSP